MTRRISLLGIILSALLVVYIVNANPDNDEEFITICSFNIKWLGNYEDRENKTLAKILKDYDIVVVQELLAPPYRMKFPNGKDAKPDPEAAAFFDAMLEQGFDYDLSSEDTGTGKKIHNNGSKTEWFVVFYKPAPVKIAKDLPHGFLAEDRSHHNDYERVPHAFAFRSQSGTLDFVLISVHLRPSTSKKSRKRRKHELTAIAQWIDTNDSEEKDFIILGDMNIKDKKELIDTSPADFVSLNKECTATNTYPKKPMPYDHVMIRPSLTKEIDNDFGMKVVKLIDATRPYWNPDNGKFPGDPYKRNKFPKYYSDHNPIVFRMILPETDDD